jgi:hypothetical protein
MTAPQPVSIIGIQRIFTGIKRKIKMWLSYVAK